MVGREMNYRYSNVPKYEESEAQHGSTSPHSEASHATTPKKTGWAGPCRVAIATAAVVLVVIVSAGAALAAAATKRTLQPSCATPMGQMDDCGESPAQARANGCRYDPMIQMWVPAACYDEAHSEMYLSAHKWKWYHDFDAKHEMPDEEMRRGEHKVAFMVDDFHRQHCAYVWEVSARALQQQRPVVDEWLSYKHVRHCNAILLAPPWNSTKHPIAVAAQTRYARCAPYRVWVHTMPDIE